MSDVVCCPNCDKKLALRDELKGKALICPQCKGRFTVPADDRSPEHASFLDSLALPAGAGSSGLSQRAAPLPSPEGGTRSAARKRAQRVRTISIGIGIAAIVLVIIVAIVASRGSGGDNEPADIRFGLSERARIELFQKLVAAVDERGVTKSCQEEWFRLADEYKLERRNIKDLLDEGFSFKNKNWELPQAVSTAKSREARMQWIASRRNGSDPILAL